ncbi:MAG: putative transrane anti-sigma factor [Verrucomicrobiales bacterium]|nr:putative transrane anti-sigma factor [Verrucomicrobiales bacterium]
MNNDQQLKLQSYLDDELSPRENRQVTEWLAVDSDARALLAELKNTTSALSGNELEVKLPEGRDFYFSKIQRQLEREAKVQAAPVREPVLARLWKYVLPLAGTAAAVIVFAMVLQKQISPATLAYVAGEGETSEEMSAYTYHSQADGMTVVWLADNSAATEVSSEAIEIQ